MNLILRGATLVGSGPGDVYVTDGKIAAEAAADAQVVDLDGALLTSGLIDIHTHVFIPAKTLGLPADRVGITQGVTTVVDAGSAGARDFDRFRAEAVETQKTRVLSWLNVSSIGLVDGRHELVDLANVDLGRSLEVIEANRDLIVGIKVRMSGSVVGDNGIKPLELAIELGERADLPVLIHTGNRPPEMSDCLDMLRPGDICSHAFHGKPGGIIDENGDARPAAIRAHERGVLFDIGHGEASLNFSVIARAKELGLIPHTISTDIHEGNVDGPVFSMAVTMSKALALGFSLDQVLAWSTTAPARAIRRPELADLSVGAPADLTVLRLVEGEFSYRDADTNPLNGQQALEPTHVIKDGELYVV
ncbi:amidohydrolase/deacetylase family metallohydrolase [Tessaracoccus caeni]|uniref:amidohydrolase/deacetylase family metallohydrolase n=1 Tax=Tessaracoccus caeni TaxID=3031239 RepID=UPI0023DA443E|nr:amidohydrolase/deacetylase family metallohydrolase [Tessaracoccus caeni]MDF1489976.1 amidohydrolase/deacetylase family metallohydrolase [Tessaracoccus caeni]